MTIATTSEPTRLRRAVDNSWLHPRYIGTIHMRAALERASPYARGVMLDVGCGLRPYEDLFLQRVTRYIGLDYPVADAKARVDIIADALQLPVADDSVDTVLATELMEHLVDPEQFLRQMSRVLRLTGTLILSVPFMEPLHEEPRDYYRFTPYSLQLMLEREGFSIEHLWPKGGFWSVVLGSFVNQAIYDFANPITEAGGSRSNGVRRFIALPLCASAQWLGYALDRFTKTRKYTLGYVVVATLSARS